MLLTTSSHHQQLLLACLCLRNPRLCLGGPAPAPPPPVGNGVFVISREGAWKMGGQMREWREH